MMVFGDLTQDKESCKKKKYIENRRLGLLKKYLKNQNETEVWNMEKNIKEMLGQ